MVNNYKYDKIGKLGNYSNMRANKIKTWPNTAKYKMVNIKVTYIQCNGGRYRVIQLCCFP